MKKKGAGKNRLERRKQPREAFQKFVRVAGFAFPDGEDSPAEAAEGGSGLGVALGVAVEFG